MMSAELFLKNATAFFLVFVRILSLLAVAPVFGNRSIPMRLRILLSLVLAGTTFPFATAAPVNATRVWQVIAYTGGEVLVGLLMGYTAGFVFYAVQFAGDIMSYQAGFTSMLSIDPSTLETVTILARFQSTLALMLYVLMDGHLFLVQALVASFEQAPLLSAGFPSGLLDLFMKMAGASIAAALQISAPILVATSLANLGLAILSRTMPQLNVLAVSFPLVIAVGVLVLAATLPAFARVFSHFVQISQREVLSVLRLLGG
jgi:flagellar biosynthetic protein FliR